MEGNDHLFETASFTAETSSRLQDAFARHERRNAVTAKLTGALDAMCTEAHSRKFSPEGVVIAMRRTWLAIPQPAGVTSEQWSRAYYSALGMCMSTYFGQKS